MTKQTWRQALLTAGKDLKVLSTDRIGILLMVLFPLVLIFVFGATMGDTTQDVRLPVHLATLEGPGSISQTIIDGIKAESGFDVRQLEPGEARQAVMDNELAGYLEFPADFSAALQSGEQTELVVYSDPGAQQTNLALYGIAQSIADEAGSSWVRGQTTMELAIDAAGPAIVPRVMLLLANGDRSPLAPTTDVELVNVGAAKGKSTATYTLPGYVTMFVFFSLVLTAEYIVAERNNGTLERLIAGRASRGSILLGKYLGNVLKGTIQAVILWTAGALLFQADLGYAPWATFLVTFAVVLCGAALGLAVATVARSLQAATTIGVSIGLLFAAMGGSWWPIYVMPSWMQTVARLTPHAWANSAFSRLLLFAAPPTAVAAEVGVLLLFAVGFGWFAVSRFRIKT